jgi:hypothetical protein
MAKIITNHHTRPLLNSWDVPPAVLQSDFDWASEEEQYFRYKGCYYALSNFVRLSKPGRLNPWNPTIYAQFEAWDAKAEDSFFSGILIKLAQDGESVIVGLYLS